MRRVLLLSIAFVGITALQFAVYPGHTYLDGETQVLVPMLEHLDSPGFLSRDPVASNPNVTFTIYDEATLFLHHALHLQLKTTLVAQQLCFRFVATIGIFLLARACGLNDWGALFLAALLSLGANLIGPDVHLVDTEPVPRSFSFLLIVAAIGLLANEKPLLAGLTGGLAFVYSPGTAAAFWLTILVMLICSRKLRHLVRPATTVLAVFALLLANIAQLQPVVGEASGLWSKLDARTAEILRYRVSEVWVSTWAPHQIWNYLALYTCGMWALTRIWPAIAFLVFMVPLPYELERNVGEPLKTAATVSSTYLLQTLGLPAIRDGNLILIDEVRLGVVDACSGLKMMVTFAAFSVGAVLLMRRSRFEKLMILLGIVPVAILTNVLRITLTGVSFANLSDERTRAFLHDLYGYMMILIGLALLALEVWVLKRLVIDDEEASSDSSPVGLGS